MVLSDIQRLDFTTGSFETGWWEHNFVFPRMMCINPNLFRNQETYINLERYSLTIFKKIIKFGQEIKKLLEIKLLKISGDVFCEPECINDLFWHPYIKKCIRLYRLYGDIFSLYSSTSNKGIIYCIYSISMETKIPFY